MPQTATESFTQPISQLTGKVEEWLTLAVDMLPNLIAAIILYFFFWLLARSAKKLVQKVFNRYAENSVLQNLFTTFIYYAVLGVGIFTVLEVLKLDKTVTSLLAGVGVIGLALGFAFQDIAANFISGIILAFRKPFLVGQIVEINGTMGKVLRTNLRVTVVLTFQGQEVYIPNKDVLQTAIVNYSALGQRRIDLAVGVSYGDNLQEVEDLVKNTIANLEGVIRKEDMIFTYTGFGNSSIDFEIKFWIDFPDNPGYLKMRNEAIKAIKAAFDANDITIPFPIRTLDFGIKGGATLSEMHLNTKN